MEAATLATTTATVVVAGVTTVFVAIIAAATVVTIVVRVVVVGIVELVDWTKAEQVASPASLGPCHYPSPASGGIDPSPSLVPLLQRNKKQRK